MLENIDEREKQLAIIEELKSSKKFESKKFYIETFGCQMNANDSEKFIGILKNQLYISVYNSTCGEIQKRKNTYVSAKGSENHGFGLVSVDRIVKKYKGFINRQNEEGVFATEILLPI